MPSIRNTGTQILPCHYTLNTVSTKPSLILVGLGLLQSCAHFSKKKRFFKIRSKHKCSHQTSNHENLCFKAPFMEKSCLSEVVIPY